MSAQLANLKATASAHEADIVTCMQELSNLKEDLVNFGKMVSAKDEMMDLRQRAADAAVCFTNDLDDLKPNLSSFEVRVTQHIEQKLFDDFKDLILGTLEAALSPLAQVVAERITDIPIDRCSQQEVQLCDSKQHNCSLEDCNVPR